MKLFFPAYLAGWQAKEMTTAKKQINVQNSIFMWQKLVCNSKRYAKIIQENRQEMYF